MMRRAAAATAAVVAGDDRFGQETWEQAERTMVQTSLNGAIQKARLQPGEIGCILGGDLLNQCVSTSYAVRDMGTRFLAFTAPAPPWPNR